MMSKVKVSHCRSVGPYVLFGAYFTLVGFALFNYRSHCVFTSPQSMIQHPHVDNSDKGRCHVDLDKLGNVHVDIFQEPTFEEIENRNPSVQKGGIGQPKDCQSWQKVAIIIPYRDRLHHLKILLNRLHPMLKRQLIEYQIFVIEQSGRDKFNRGKLMNVGYLEALQVAKFDCFIFHDADLIPENNKNLYMCDQHARHLSSAIDEMRYHVMYYNYAGGVIALNRESFRRINGYSNSYWGWGNEDDDLSARIQEAGLLLTRPPEHIGRFKMVRHTKQSRAEHGNELFFYWRGRWAHDGLNDLAEMNYTVKSTTHHNLYTLISVDIGKPPAVMPVPQKDAVRETLWWFLKFYYP